VYSNENIYKKIICPTIKSESLFCIDNLAAYIYSLHDDDYIMIICKAYISELNHLCEKEILS